MATVKILLDDRLCMSYLFHVEQVSGLATLLLEGASELGVQLTDRNVSEFFIYFNDLLDWNRKINLTAITQEQDVVVKHFLDSIACSKALNAAHAASLLDIGSGAGFPGLPLKIVYPDLDLTLLEPSLKKTAFLRHLIGTLHMRNAVVISKRIQELVKDQAYHGRFSYIVTRAVEVNQILPFTRPLLKTNGRLVLCRSKPLDQHISLYGLQLKDEIAYRLPGGYGDRVLSVLEPAPAIRE